MPADVTSSPTAVAPPPAEGVVRANPVREAIGSGRFTYFVELVATASMREARLMEIATLLARVPGVVAGGITSYAGGSAGHDPMRIAAAARTRGLTPNFHLTCVNRDRLDIRNTLEDLDAIGIHNIFAISGDYPKASGSPGPGPYAMDSVQLVEMIRELRDGGKPYFISVAVSPFKYSEPECMYQYLKLEKKIAAGADFAITQLGYDARKFRELKRYLDERGLKTPVLGNVYVLSLRAAEKMSKGEPPGCWVAPELVEKIREESKAPDKGLGARLERAAKMVAIVRGLGYAGAYIGGDHSAKNIHWIIERSEQIAHRWEEFAEELSHGPKGGFYLYDGTPHTPPHRGAIPKMMDAMGRMFPVTRETKLRAMLRGILGWIDHNPAMANTLERFEFAVKSPMFGCQACGNCVLGHMEYVCPQTCPKGMRNGPCGGTYMGTCEVEDKPCIWNKVYENARAAGRVDELRTYIPPRNLALKGTSSWINYFLNRDSRPGNDTSKLADVIVPVDQIRPAGSGNGTAQARGQGK